MIVYTSRALLPVSSPPSKDGAVAVEDGRIVQAGPRDRVLEAAGEGVETRDLGNVALLPGLVNAHTHVELSWMAQDPPPGGEYMAWLRGLLERRAAEDRPTARSEAKRAVQFMIERGTVAVGDVANETWVVPVLARSELCGILFHEVYGFRAADANRLLKEAARRVAKIAKRADLAKAGDRWRVALTAHAPHTTSSPLLRGLGAHAHTAKGPLSIHVAESKAEVALLEDGSGPLPDLLREREMWEDGWAPPGLGPLEHLDRLGLLSPNTLAVHCVQLVQQDHSRLQTRGVRVVTCPRSNRRLGVGRAPVHQLLREGIPVALGTDSLASAPDLDLFAEMAAVRDEHPEISPAAVLRMATLNGAEALGLADRLGSIEAGKLARLIVVPLASPDDDALETVCSVPSRVYALDRAPWEAAG